MRRRVLTAFDPVAACRRCGKRHSRTSPNVTMEPAVRLHQQNWPPKTGTRRPRREDRVRHALGHGRAVWHGARWRNARRRSRTNRVGGRCHGNGGYPRSSKNSAKRKCHDAPLTDLGARCDEPRSCRQASIDSSSRSASATAPFSCIRAPSRIRRASRSGANACCSRSETSSCVRFRPICAGVRISRK